MIARRPHRPCRPCLLAPLMLLALTATAAAHQSSTTYSQVELSPDRQSLAYRLLTSPPDLAEALGLAADTVPSDEQLRRGADLLFDYVLGRIQVRDGDVPCVAEPGGVGFTEDEGRFAELRWQVTCPEPVARLVIEYELFFDLDPLHLAFLRVQVPGQETANAQLRDGEARFVWDLGERPPSYLLAFLRSGVEHIVFGFDHVCFLLALLMVVVLMRDTDGSWRGRDVPGGLRHTALIVTSFTVAHSVTLISAALGWIVLPERLVESTIAASIIYVAVENVIRPEPRYRHAVTFVFGLVHGLGFASMLQVMLPPEGVVAPLLMFNLGVELGQIAIVLVALPLLDLLRRRTGAGLYRRRVMPVMSVVLALAGLAWLVDRAFTGW